MVNARTEGRSYVLTKRIVTAKEYAACKWEDADEPRAGVATIKKAGQDWNRADRHCYRLNGAAKAYPLPRYRTESHH